MFEYVYAVRRIHHLLAGGLAFIYNKALINNEASSVHHNRRMNYAIN